MRHPVPQMVAHWLVIYHTKWYIYPFPHKKTTIFHSVHTFTHIRQHCFSKYWGDQCMGRPPPQILGGTVPPIPPRSPPLGIPERFEDAKIYGKEFTRWSKKIEQLLNDSVNKETQEKKRFEEDKDRIQKFEERLNSIGIGEEIGNKGEMDEKWTTSL